MCLGILKILFAELSSNHMITSFISHRWFSGKISRCHPTIGQYRLAPGSIPGRCIFASLVGGEGDGGDAFGGGGAGCGWDEQRFLPIGASGFAGRLPRAVYFISETPVQFIFPRLSWNRDGRGGRGGRLGFCIGEVDYTLPSIMIQSSLSCMSSASGMM